MKIVLFGATGEVGSRIAREFERRGHEVVSATRAAGADATDPSSVAAAVAGADAVVSAVSAREGTYSQADVAGALVEGLRRGGVRRLVVVGGSGCLLNESGVRLLEEPDFEDDYKPEALDQADALEVFRGVDDVDWTYVSPAPLIQPGERTGAYRLGGDVVIGSEISAEDYAIAIADLVEDGGHVRERVSAAW